MSSRMQRGLAPGTSISAGAEQGHGAEADAPGGGGREHGDHVGRGREEDADEVVLDQAVAPHHLAQQLLDPLGHLLARCRRRRWWRRGGRGRSGPRASAGALLPPARGPACRRSASRRWPSRPGPHLGRAQRPPLPGARPGRLSGPIRVRTRRRTGWPDGLAHAPDLAVAALVDDDAQHPGRDHAHPGRRRQPVLELHPLAQRAAGPRPRGRRPPRPGTPCPPRRRGGSAAGPGRRRWSATSRPSVSTSSRPTGNTRGSSGTSETTVGPALGVRRPWSPPRPAC